MALGLPDLQNHPCGYADAMTRGLVRAKCVHVTDGDTADFLLDLGWYQYLYARLRIRGIDTAERRGTRGRKKQAAEAAFERARELLLDRYALVRTDKGKKTFDRFVADVWIPVSAKRLPRGVASIRAPRGARWCSFAELLIAEGHAAPYPAP